nr:type II toxin-antitoxin system RelE/ParE family toxin [Chlorobium phaeobacteroides]
MERCSCRVVGIPYRCYRVICEILDEKVSVLVVRVGHRKEVYR